MMAHNKLSKEKIAKLQDEKSKKLQSNKPIKK